MRCERNFLPSSEFFGNRHLRVWVKKDRERNRYPSLPVYPVLKKIESWQIEKFFEIYRSEIGAGRWNIFSASRVGF